MKLVASVIVRNEAGRYLEACLTHLLEFCDEVRVLDDGSTDGWRDLLTESDRVIVKVREGAERDSGKDFRSHADARNELLRFTLAGEPTHVLAIDADEFVTDGQALRRSCASPFPALSLTMTEVWEAYPEGLCTREDGGWRAHEVTMLWRPQTGQSSMIRDLGPATGRTPQVVSGMRSTPARSSVLHFGWAAESERQTRFEKYMRADGGKFHALTHLQSIIWPCDRISLSPLDWPTGLLPYRDMILARANG